MDQKPLIKLIEDRLERDHIELPVFHPIALQLRQLVKKDDYSAADLAQVVQKDQVLVTNVLKIANSFFYAGMQPIGTIREAIVRLGTESLLNLVTAVTQIHLYDSQENGLSAWMGPLWSHALGVASGVRWLSFHLGLRQFAEEGFLAGLLHDIGKVLLLKLIEDLKKSSMLDKNLSQRVIDEILEGMHARFGELLLRRQNIPETYCRVASMHHDALVASEETLLNLVRLANSVCHKLGIGPKHNPEIPLSTTLDAVNLMAKDLTLAELQVRLEEHMASLHRLTGLTKQGSYPEIS